MLRSLATRKYPDILKKLLVRDLREGGRLAIVYGPQGSGKTTLLEWVARGVYEIYGPDEVIIWRGQEDCLWADFLEMGIPVRILYLGPEPIIVDGITGEPVGLDVPIVPVETPQAVLDACHPDYVNVLYIHATDPLDFTARWLEVFKLLRYKPHGWVSLFFDEIEDLAPANAQGELWNLNKEIARMVKEFRKNLTSLYAATQNHFDLDFRVKGKFQFKIYLAGAIVPDKSRVWQKAVDALPKGWGWVEGTKFEPFCFDPLPKGPKLKVLNYAI
ncbi:MAG: hypothetical protein DRJ98_08280 [Thermoprotei archaeon]|nr:MAG: hypothetical protein DRJ98_08280 [Thermoprotei archaeon]